MNLCLNVHCSVTCMCHCVETLIVISGENVLKRTENNVAECIRV
jgi:hypothetical protein